MPSISTTRPLTVGFDASFYDPLAQQMCHSDTYRVLTRLLMDVAARHAAGRLLCMHEGGYSASYVPFCGVAVLEELSGADSGVRDPMLASALVGYHDLQPWQDAVITAAEAGPLAALRKALESRC
jgi:Histone deacetylase domain